ncbi:hypothetical protein LSM04_005869 [Trypanosoma melophagium]|uniref:uncharacterized protein n=1 Tax=Trypanosoma melophagium TaxID=715481 RepID=UPI00351A52DA|nr:hypothetical protein LSM04_005869 [Trypanosoma melophagium]
MSYLPCRRSLNSDYNKSTSTTPNHTFAVPTSGLQRSNKKKDSIASLDTVSSLVDLAIRSGCKDVLHRKCHQLIERITFLADGIIETTSTALDDGITESPEPRRVSQKHVDPMNAISTATRTTTTSAIPLAREKSGSIRNATKSNTNTNNNNTNTITNNNSNNSSNNNGVQKMKSVGGASASASASAVVNNQNGVRSHSSSISRNAGDRPLLGMPAVLAVKEEPRVGENRLNGHTKRNEKSKSPQPKVPATRPLHNSVSRGRVYESLGELLYSTGTRDARPLFVEERELSEEDVRKTLSLVSPTDRILYCELLHVQSSENVSCISSVSTSHTNDTTRFLRYGSFTKAIYLHAPVDFYTALDVNTVTTPGKPSVQFKGDCGKFVSSPSPSLLSVRSSNAKTNSVKTAPFRETRHETQSNNNTSNTRAKSLPISTTSVTKVHKKEKTNNNNNNNSISTPAPVVWYPTLPVQVSNPLGRKVSSNERSTSQGRFNGEYKSGRTCNSREVNCSNSNVGYFDADGNNNDGNYADVDVDDDDDKNDSICITKESYNPLFLNIAGHLCSIFFTPALSHHGKRTRGVSLRIHHDKPIELCVTLPASPA